MPPKYSASIGLACSRRCSTSSPMASGPPGPWRLPPDVPRAIRPVVQRQPAVGDGRRQLHVLRAERGDIDRDPVPDGVGDQLQRLAEAGPLALGERDLILGA